MTRIVLFSLMFFLEATQAFSSIKIKVFHTKTQLAQAAADIFFSEIEQAEINHKKLVFILPTGSTPLPMYQEIVQRWQSSNWDFSSLTFFNLDEYVGLSSEHPKSYAFFMEQHFYRYFADHPRGIKKDQYFFPGNGSHSLEYLAEFKQHLHKHLNDPDTRVVLFAGIGRGPAHIAFNDFTEELENIPQENHFDYALNSQTRFVPLDIKTREANKIHFDSNLNLVPTHAVTLGFYEILKADRIIIMANDLSKKESIEQTFAGEPNVKSPASLLRTSHRNRDIEFLLTENSYTPILNPEVKVLGLSSVLNLSRERASILVAHDEEKPLEQLLHKVSFRPQDQITFLFTPGSESFYQAFITRFHHHHIRTCDQLTECLEHFSDVMILPQIEEIKIKVREHYEKASHQPIFVFYQTHKSRLLSYNSYLTLSQEQIDHQKKALEVYRSQIFRTPFSDLAKELAIQAYHDFSPLVREGKGLELFLSGKISEGQFYKDINSFKELDPKQWNHDDRLIVVAPHPDDAEIGAGGLIHRLQSRLAKLTVWNMTSGKRAVIALKDILNHPYLDESTKEKVMEYQNQEFLHDLPLKGSIRAQESKNALSLLNPAVQLKQLDLPFYDQNYILGDYDRKMISGLIQEEMVQATGKIYISLPMLEDDHMCHRQASLLVFEELKKISQHHGITFHILFYRTPWTGQTNLYLFDDQAHPFQAWIGGERILFKGGDGRGVLQNINKRGAFPLEVMRF